MKEVWRPVFEFEGHYEVSDQGRVRSVDRVVPFSSNGRHFNRKVRGRILKLKKTTRGYVTVGLKLSQQRQSWKLVHRLVAEAFLVSSCDRHVNHKDGDKTNNSLENLEWVTPKENMQHAVREGLHWAPRGEACVNAVLTEEDIRKIRSMRASGAENRTLADRFGVHINTIYDITKKRRWKHV